MEQLKAVILAAGKGTRMKSDLPKVVHTIEGKCLVDYAIEAAIGAGADDICLVVGYKYEVVRETILHQEVSFVLQEEQLGTGHAVRCAKDFLGDLLRPRALLKMISPRLLPPFRGTSTRCSRSVLPSLSAGQATTSVR